MRNKTLWAFFAGIWCGLALQAYAATNTLQFQDDFEAYSVGTPLTNGLNYWYASATDAVVQSVVGPTGWTKAAMVPVDVSLSNRYTAASSTNLWLQMDVRAVRYDGTNFPVAQTNASSQFYINSNGYFAVYDGVSGWRVASNDVSGAPLSPISENSWIHLDLRLNYQNQTWQLDCDYRTICTGVNFASAAPAHFQGFEVYSGGNSTSYLDNVDLIDMDAMPHLSVSPPGLTNSVAFGLPPPTQYLDVICSGDGALDYVIITNPVVAWLSAQPATGSLTNFATNTVTVSYFTNGLTPGRRETELWVISTNWGGSTQVVPIVFDLGSLRVSPTALTNTAMQGCNPSNQTFIVTNGGAGVFNYTVATNAAWLHVSAVAGTIAPGEVRTHTVAYAAAALAPDQYSGLISVVSTNQGGVTQTVAVVLNVVAQPVLCVQPTNLTQLVEKGANPTGMSFQICNASVPPRVRMDYMITNNVWWILPCVNGSSSGETNTVGVNFADMTEQSTGTYNGVITIVSRDNGTGYSPIGAIVQTARVNVAITIRSLPAPSWISAGSGTDTGKVVITWAAVAPFEGGRVYYEVWRGTTRDFDEQFTVRIAGSLGTNRYDDTSAEPGVIYYYWVRPVNGYGGIGALSDYDSGYRALGVPEGIWATEGAYSDKVYVHWSGVDGAAAYEVWRSASDWTLVQTTAGLEYNDFNVEEGVAYQYKIRAIKGGTVIQPGAFSRTVSGCVLSRPSGLSASQGTVIGKVRLAWNAGQGTTAYDIWRLSGASYEQIGTTTELTYDDANVSVGMNYTYKVRGRNDNGVTDFCEPASGYPGARGVDMAVWQPILLPHTLAAGASPRVVSARVGNLAGAAMSGNDARVLITCYASNQQSGAVTEIGALTTSLNLPVGGSQVVSLPSGAVCMPASAGTYTIWMDVYPAWPSQLSDTNTANNVAAVRGAATIATIVTADWWGFNDYDGDGISDMVMDMNGAWYARTVDSRLLAWAVPFGAGMSPVRGLDFDGDNRAEPIVFRDGTWAGMLSAAGYAYGSTVLGGPGCLPVIGDYTGNGRGNLGVYSVPDGRWYVLDDAFRPLVWGDVFGAPDVQVVPGDYDGDGVWDLTLYHIPSGGWYSRGVDGSLKLWGVVWGGSQYRPVMGDYDGDGIFDLAVYREATGIWNIQTAQGEEIVRNYWFGGSGYIPVPGDYDGDGCWDLAIYNRNTGYWQIRSLTAGTILGSTLWGVAGYVPVGAQ